MACQVKGLYEKLTKVILILDRISENVSKLHANRITHAEIPDAKQRRVTMKAAVLKETGRIVVKDVADVTPAPGEILIKTRYAGVCGSDVHTFEGHHPFRKPPVILGHELTGTVVELGEQVDGFSEGDAVTIMPLAACGSCIQCRCGKPNLCPEKEMPGMNDWAGTFAENFVSRPAVTFKLGKNSDLKTGIFIEPLAVAIHSVRQARQRSKSHVLVLGAGPIGILTAVAAGMEGAETIVVTDLCDDNLTVARQLSGAATYNAGAPDMVDRIGKDHPAGFGAVFLCNSADSTVKQSMTLAESGARIIVTGWYTDPVALDLTEITLRELEMVGSLAYDHDDFETALKWVDSGQIPFGKLISHVFPLEQAETALKLLSDRKDNPLKVLLDFDG